MIGAKRELAKPQFNSTVLVQEIVNILKKPPFNENLTLMSFDEKKEVELLELIMKVLSMIDSELKITKNDNETMVLKKILDFLKTVNFPYSSEKQLEDDLNRADKKLFIQIIHFTLTKTNELKKIHYCAKYLNNIKIPDELAGDEELLDLQNQYRELQIEFQATYQLAEEKRSTKPQLKDIKDEIKKLGTDKIQLNNNINNYKKNYINKSDFLALFEATSRLRKEQEEDSNLEKRLNRQYYELEEIDNKLMIAKQRFHDSKNSLRDDISAFDMLENLRNQRDKNRETVSNLTKYDLVDKKSKLKALEEILTMPEISYDMLNSTRQEKKSLESEIERLEVSVKENSSKTSEISIYKNNALMAVQAKENCLKTYEKLEKEKQMLDEKNKNLEKKFEMSHGHRYIRKDDLIQQVDSIRKKKELYTKLSKIIDNINGDSLLLDRTIHFLKPNTEDYEEIVTRCEEKFGTIKGRKELEDLAKRKKDIDQSKEITLEEYSKLIVEFKKKIENTYSQHAPLIDQQAKLKAEYEMILPDYNKKKNNYDNNMQDTLKPYNKVKEEYDQLEAEFAKYQNDYHKFNIEMKITEDLIKRYESENSFQKDVKRLNKEFKNFTEYYREIMSHQSVNIKELDLRKNTVKEQSQDNYRQIKFFNDMKKLLLTKKATLLNEKK